MINPVKSFLTHGPLKTSSLRARSPFKGYSEKSRVSDTRKEARERGNGEKKGVALLSFVPRSCVFSWLALLRPSRRHSRVLEWLASQDT